MSFNCKRVLIIVFVLLISYHILTDVCNVNLTRDGFSNSVGAPFSNSTKMASIPNTLKQNNIQAAQDYNKMQAEQVVKPAVIPTESEYNVNASEQLGSNEVSMPVSGISRTPTSCFPQNALTPQDLLPESKGQVIKDFDEANPAGEGILKGVNFLDAGFHVGVNTVGQSLRNANRQLRAEPPNPQVNVSPWMNTTIGPDLARIPLDSNDVCTGSN